MAYREIIRLLRMARWVRRPPGKRRIIMWLTVLAITLAIWGAESLFGTPEWMRLEGPGWHRLR